MLKCDRWIKEMASKGMIEPFESKLVRRVGENNVISYGLSSYGYDIRLSPVEFRVFRHIPGTVINPKNFNLKNLELVELESDDFGYYFTLPAHSYGLGVALEYLSIPPNITCLFIGKSTYARCGLIWNLTPGEASWRGWLTLEVSNSSNADCRVYTNEGVIQALFFEGEPCETTYNDRQGKYQDQEYKVTIAKV